MEVGLGGVEGAARWPPKPLGTKHLTFCFSVFEGHNTPCQKAVGVASTSPDWFTSKHRLNQLKKKDVRSVKCDQSSMVRPHQKNHLRTWLPMIFALGSLTSNCPSMHAKWCALGLQCRPSTQHHPMRLVPVRAAHQGFRSVLWFSQHRPKESHRACAKSVV